MRKHLSFDFHNAIINFKEKTKELIRIAKDEKTLGVMLVIDNGGGSCNLFSSLHDTIKEITALKPVIGLITGSASSMGYAIASSCNYIIAHSLSSIGNIGVMRDYHKYKNPKMKNNIQAELEVEFFTAGQYKANWSPYKPLTNADRAYIQESVNQTYQELISLIAQNRNLDATTYKDWAEAKDFKATEAVKIGLIDEIGTFFTAERKIIELIAKRNPEMKLGTSITPVNYETPAEPKK